MPFFSRNTEPVEEPTPIAEEPPKKHGFFGSRSKEAFHEPVQEPPVEETPHRRHGLFGSRNRSPSPTPSHRTDATHSTRYTSSTYHTSPEREQNGGGLFRRGTDASSGRRSLLHRSFGNGNNSAELDPSIVQARERVMSAEAAERDADRALMAARESVRQAHEHVKRLELEAQEEARRAKIKQYHAREVSKRGKQLGRHGI